VQYAFAQRTNSSLDTLSGKGFEYLKTRFEETIYDRRKSNIYVMAWLQKAKEEKENYLQLALAYKACVINADKSARPFYADSMVINATRFNDIELTASAYLTKGIVHYERMEHSKALDYYLKADQYASRTANSLLVYKIKYGIAQIKYYLGFYDEAISLLRECVDYFREENDRAYLNSLHALGLSYMKVGKYDFASETNQLGIDQGKLFEDTSMEFYFNHSEAINMCYRGNFKATVKKLNEVLPNVIQLKDYANESATYYYLGKSYWSLQQHDKAIIYFKKVDRIFQQQKYILPDLRKGYEYLIDYYKQKGDSKAQLLYINQLLIVDKALAQDYKYLLTKIVKEYDTKELLAAKNAIENTVIFTRIAAGIVVLLMAMIIIHLIQKNRRNKKLFEELMNRDTASHIVPSNTIFDESEIDFQGITETGSNGKPSRTISPDIEAAIVKKLEKFEGNKKYLEKDMTVRKMAALLNTNDKYVTKVIAKHRGKGTIEYITDLKLDYIVEMLKTDSRYRNYTNKALGEEAGFRTTQNFTRAFKSYTGITPTYFSSKLKRSITTDDFD
jgi:AraC-like DNA-binding protein